MGGSLDHEWSVSRRIGDEPQLPNGDRVAQQLVPRADGHRRPSGIEVNDVARLPHRSAESPPLPDREAGDTVVVADDPAARVDKLARTRGAPGINEAGALPPTHEADVHAVWLLGRSQRELNRPAA